MRAATPAVAPIEVRDNIQIEEALLVNILEKVSYVVDETHRLSMAIDKLTKDIEELLPAARRAAKMLDNSKTVKIMEMVKGATRRG